MKKCTFFAKNRILIIFFLFIQRDTPYVALNKTMESREKHDFFQDVYEIVRQIPRGKVSTYGAISSYLGAARGARTVGWALNNCHHIQPPVPAHRVVNRNGQLTGKRHFSAPNDMQERLEIEGIRVKNDVIERFEELFWHPSKELII